MIFSTFIQNICDWNRDTIPTCLEEGRKSEMLFDVAPGILVAEEAEEEICADLPSQHLWSCSNPSNSKDTWCKFACDNHTVYHRKCVCGKTVSFLIITLKKMSYVWLFRAATGTAKRRPNVWHELERKRLLFFPRICIFFNER